MTGQQPPRADGETPCPRWCAVDHSTNANRIHSAGPVYIRMPGAFEGLLDGIRVRAIQLALEGEAPEVVVGTSRYGVPEAPDPSLWLKPEDAKALAVIVEMLAAATPDQHRELADAIRNAAADITGIGEDR
jgi:hypothetical protein